MMSPEHHLFVSALLASLFYYFTSSIPGSILAFCGGFWIDLDHFIDFWLYKKRITYTKEFFTWYCLRSGKIYIIFHSLELWIVLLSSSLILKSLPLLGLSIGMGIHLLMDIFGNGARPEAYLLAYRILVGFSTEKMIKQSVRIQ
jgi:hypothetical protein